MTGATGEDGSDGRAPGARGARRTSVELRSALIGGGVTALIAFSGLVLVGRLSPFRAIALLEAIVPTIRFLSSATLTGGITMLALLLALLSFTATHEHDFTEAHYERIQQISAFNALLIIMSMVLLMVLSVPLDEAETFRQLYSWVYIGVVTLMALLGGLLISVVIMLHSTIRGLVHALHPGAESSLIHSHDRGSS